MPQEIIRKPKQIKKPGGEVYVKCAYCGKENITEWCKSEGFIITKCSCGLTYPNPRLSINEINSSYNNQDMSSVQDYLEIEEDNKRDFERRIKLIERFAKKGGKMLDVGCNIGSLIEVAQNHGLNCLGIDVNKCAVDIAKRRGLNCSTQDFFKIKAKFDLITMNDVIEHLEDPNDVLKKAYSLLNEGGHLFITTPKGDSFMAKLTRGRWLHRKPREHLYIFTEKTMVKMLESKGFKVLQSNTIGRIRSIKIIIKKAGSYSKSIRAFLNAIIPNPIKKSSISINPLDEMYFIARKI